MIKNIILFIPSIERGGVEKNLFLISNHLDLINRNIFLITANSDYKKRFNKKIRVICPKSNIWVKKSRIIKTLISAYLLFVYFFNKKSIILSFQSNVIAIFLSKILNFKIIVRLNTSLEKYIKNNFSKVLYKFFYSLADRIVVNSYFFKKEIKKKLNLDSILIYNSQEKKKKKKKLIFFKNFKGLKILNIGRLTDQKDQITLLKSLKILLKKKVYFKCCIIGEGEKRKELLDYIDNNNLRSSVKLIGYKKNAEIYLDFSDLFILTSKFEGLPNVLIESQSKNIPIISSNCPTGPREILLNGTLGDLFDVGNYKKLSELIINFRKNKKRLVRKSKKAKNYLIRFNIKSNSKKYEKIIRSLDL